MTTVTSATPFAICSQFIQTCQWGSIGICHATALGSRDSNQDMCKVLSFRHNKYDRHIVLCVVCDGHGGFMASTIVCAALPHVLAHLSDPFDKTELTECIERLDKSMLSHAKDGCLDTDGCCLAVAMLAVVENTLKICKFTVGDTGITLIDMQRHAPLFVSSEHKPHAESEKKRIYASGATIVGERVGTLNVSRTIGDGASKRGGAVVATPDVSFHNIDLRSNADTAIVLHSDGLFDGLHGKTLRSQALMDCVERVTADHLVNMTNGKKLAVTRSEQRLFEQSLKRMRDLGVVPPTFTCEYEIVAPDDGADAETESKAAATVTSAATAPPAAPDTHDRLSVSDHFAYAINAVTQNSCVRAKKLAVSLMTESLGGNAKRPRDNTTVMVVFIPGPKVGDDSVHGFSSLVRMDPSCNIPVLPIAEEEGITDEARKSFVRMLFSDAHAHRVSVENVVKALGLSRLQLHHDYFRLNKPGSSPITEDMVLECGIKELAIFLKMQNCGPSTVFAKIVGFLSDELADLPSVSVCSPRGVILASGISKAVVRDFEVLASERHRKELGLLTVSGSSASDVDRAETKILDTFSGDGGNGSCSGTKRKLSGQDSEQPEPKRQKTGASPLDCKRPTRVKLILCDTNPLLVDEWRKAFAAISTDAKNVTILDPCGIQDVKLPYDCVVSAGNSFGIMDGGIDYALCDRIFGWLMLTRTQKAVMDEFAGQQPVGTCLIVPTESSKCPFLAHCPTMAVPRRIDGYEQRVVFDCMRSMLVSVLLHNNHSNAFGQRTIDTVLCTGLGTGCGGIPPRVCARLMAEAYSSVLSEREAPRRKLDQTEDTKNGAPVAYYKVGWREATDQEARIVRIIKNDEALGSGQIPLMTGADSDGDALKKA